MKSPYLDKDIGKEKNEKPKLNICNISILISGMNLYRNYKRQDAIVFLRIKSVFHIGVGDDNCSLGQIGRNPNILRFGCALCRF